MSAGIINLTHCYSPKFPQCWDVVIQLPHAGDARHVLRPSTPCHSTGQPLYCAVPLAGTGCFVGTHRHCGHHLVHGAGHSPAGGPGVHDPVAAPAQPVHRPVHDSGAGPGGGYICTVLLGLVDRRAGGGGHSPASLQPPDLPAPRLLRKQPQLGNPVAADH